MANWKIKEGSDYKNPENLSVHPLILKILSQKGIGTDEGINNFLNPDYERDTHDPFLFLEMEKAVKRIKQAREKKEKVAIFGDYDADGVTSTAIIKETLDEIGISSFIYIPDKKIEGYGMNTGAVNDFRQKEVKLIITVDCGISNAKEIEEAESCGINVIIIDHHHIPKQLPRACAIINPQMKNSGYPSKILAGVGVTFKVVQAIYETFLPEKKEQLKWLLDIVAIGTVADCVPLLGENRVLVKYGLIVLSKTRRIGLREIFSVARLLIDENNIPNTYNISFQIAPRINSAGRMDHANTAYNLVREKSQVKARELALELESNNQQRQKVTEKVVEEVKILAENSFKDKKLIFAVGEHFPIGVVGLVAGKVSEIFMKPAAVLQKGEKESQGSFRSIPQVNIIEAIEKCSEYLIKFGGHAQAAGIKIANENLEKFYEKLNSIIEKELEGKDISPEIEIDAEINLDKIDFQLIEGLQKMEPFGEGNRQPVFLSRNLTVNEATLVGNGEKHLKLFLRSENNSPKIYEAIGFNFAGQFRNIKPGDKIDAVFNVEEDEWNGSKKIQLKLIDMKKIN